MSDWQSDFDKFLGKKDNQQQERDQKLKANKALVSPFIKGNVLPACEEVKAALERHGRRVKIENKISQVNIIVRHNDNRVWEFHIRVEADAWHDSPVVTAWAGTGVRIISHTDASELTQADIRQVVLEAYKRA